MKATFFAGISALSSIPSLITIFLTSSLILSNACGVAFLYACEMFLRSYAYVLLFTHYKVLVLSGKRMALSKDLSLRVLVLSLCWKAFEDLQNFRQGIMSNRSFLKASNSLILSGNFVDLSPKIQFLLVVKGLPSHLAGQVINGDPKLFSIMVVASES